MRKQAKRHHEAPSNDYYKKGPDDSSSFPTFSKIAGGKKPRNEGGAEIVTGANASPVLSKDTVDYLVSLANHLMSEADPDMIETLTDRCKEECGDIDPLSLLSSEQCCRALEIVCESSTDLSGYFLEKLLRLKRKNLCKIFDSNSAARCLESMLYKVGQCVNDRKSPDDVIDRYSNAIKDVCEISVENIDRMCTEYGGSHLLRCLCRVLCGVAKKSDVTGPNAARADRKPEKPANEGFRQCLNNLFNFLLDWEYVSGYLHCEPVSLLVQDLIELNANIAKTTHLNRFIDNCVASDSKLVHNQICDKQASRVYEKLILHCNEDQLRSIFNNHLKSSLADLCSHRFANFVVQRLLERCSSEEMLASIFDQILPIFDDLWLQGKHGVLVAMAKACANTKCRQKDFMSLVRKRVGCTNKADKVHLVPLLLQLQHLEKIELDSFGNVPIDSQGIKSQGSLLLQALLLFKSTDDICDSFLRLNNDELVRLAKHCFASRFIDAFLQSASVKQEQKLKFFYKLKNDFHKIACDRIGSFVLEQLWNSSVISGQMREELASILAKKQSAMISNQWGKIIWSKFDLNAFVNNKKQWRAKFAQT